VARGLGGEVYEAQVTPHEEQIATLDRLDLQDRGYSVSGGRKDSRETK
jgi:hypothetical protein